ncbi:MAG: hypothetical protein MZV70_55865 [Desulfobacterales bacterium]|nr:hypothetical protein [Desulfobacterales bacterium]
MKPLLVEKSDPAAGSSGACDGLVFLQSKKPGLHLKLALESRSALRRPGRGPRAGHRVQEPGRHVPHRKRGGARRHAAFRGGAARDRPRCGADRRRRGPAPRAVPFGEGDRGDLSRRWTPR